MTSETSTINRRIGVIINAGLVGLAASAWLAQSIPEFNLLITAVTALVVTAICIAALKVSIRSSLLNSEFAEEEAATAVVAEAGHGLEPNSQPDTSIESLKTWLDELRKVSEPNGSHRELYWKLLNDIEVRIPPHGKEQFSAGKSTYDLTLNLINLHIHSPEMQQSRRGIPAHQDKIDIIIPD